MVDLGHKVYYPVQTSRVWGGCEKLGLMALSYWTLPQSNSCFVLLIRSGEDHRLIYPPTPNLP
jgi:hypothetical protein